MISQICEYIGLQAELAEAIRAECADLWDFPGAELMGWECDPHGEHICCTNIDTRVQVELPLLSESATGIDIGHFAYYLVTLNRDSPSYSELHALMESLEQEGVLKQVQVGDHPKIWGLNQAASGDS